MSSFESRTPAEDEAEKRRIATQVLRESEGEEREGFQKSVPPSEAVVREAADVIARAKGLGELPEVAELPVEDFHGDLTVKPVTHAHTVDFRGLSEADKQAVFGAAQEQAKKTVAKNEGAFTSQQLAMAESILRAGDILADAERRLGETEQKWAQAETDRAGIVAREGGASREELDVATQRTHELKTELVRRQDSVAKMRAVYDGLKKNQS